MQDAQPNQANQDLWIGPVSFSDVDLKLFAIVSTRVYGTCRITFYTTFDRWAAYLLIEGEFVPALTDKIIYQSKVGSIPLGPEAMRRIDEYVSAGAMREGQPWAIRVAEGRQAKHGLDSVLEWHIDEPGQRGVGKEKSGGAVDYRERETFVRVRPGQHL